MSFIVKRLILIALFGNRQLTIVFLTVGVRFKQKVQIQNAFLHATKL